MTNNDRKIEFLYIYPVYEKCSCHFCMLRFYAFVKCQIRTLVSMYRNTIGQCLHYTFSLYPGAQWEASSFCRFSLGVQEKKIPHAYVSRCHNVNINMPNQQSLVSFGDARFQEFGRPYVASRKIKTYTHFFRKKDDHIYLYIL